MLAAELRGKLPSSIRQLEDVMTSYVFGFLHNASRSVYLRRFLEDAVGIRTTEREAEEAEFQFWPTLADGTEPDLVVVVGSHYLLFEAKLHSPIDQSQLAREFERGSEVAGREDLEFRLVVVTAHSCTPRNELSGLGCDSSRLCWINWQRVTQMILSLMEQHSSNLPDIDYAKDLVAILEARQLRGYRGFHDMPFPTISPSRGLLFLQAETMDYRDDFLGFAAALATVAAPGPPPETMFFSHTFFRGFKHTNSPNPCRGSIFFGGS